MFDQSDIDSLLASASELASEGEQADEAAHYPPAPSAEEKPPRNQSSVRTGNKGQSSGTSPSAAIGRDFGRILKMKIPLIVMLAERSMTVNEILKLTHGSIIEFDRPSDSEQDLVVGNQAIGMGQAVKVGENFGLRITEIRKLADRIKAMGGMA